MRVYLDYLDGGKGIYPSDPEMNKYRSDVADMPKIAYWLYCIGGRLQSIAWRFVRREEPID